jgi:hypothetical protein
MEIEQISVEPLLLLRPSSLKDIDSRVNDNSGDQNLTADWIGAGRGIVKELRTLLLDLLNRGAVFFWSYGEGEKRNYLGDLATLIPHGALSDDSGHAHSYGAGPLVLPEKILWSNLGDGREFRIGLELRQDIHNPQFTPAAVFPATDIGLALASIAAALGAITNGIDAPNPGSLFAVLDLRVFLHGARRELATQNQAGPG